MLMLAVTLPVPIPLNKSVPRCSIKHCLVTACTALLSALSLPWLGLCCPGTVWDITQGSKHSQQAMRTQMYRLRLCPVSFSSILAGFAPRPCNTHPVSCCAYSCNTAVTLCSALWTEKTNTKSQATQETTMAVCMDTASLCHFTSGPKNGPWPCFIYIKIIAFLKSWFVLAYLGTEKNWW